MRIGVRLGPLEPDVASLLAEMSQLGFVVLIGWLAIVGLDMAADANLARFRVDLRDNLLARKHATRVRVLRRALQHDRACDPAVRLGERVHFTGRLEPATRGSGEADRVYAVRISA
jgi:hypothetical protein